MRKRGRARSFAGEFKGAARSANGKWAARSFRIGYRESLLAAPALSKIGFPFANTNMNELLEPLQGSAHFCQLQRERRDASEQSRPTRANEFAKQLKPLCIEQLRRRESSRRRPETKMAQLVGRTTGEQLCAQPLGVLKIITAIPVGRRSTWPRRCKYNNSASEPAFERLARRRWPKAATSSSALAEALKVGGAGAKVPARKSARPGIQLCARSCNLTAHVERSARILCF